MKRLIAVVFSLLVAEVSFGQAPPAMQAVPIDTPIAPSIPLVESGEDTEQWERYWGQDMVRNVSRPALYPVLPSGTRRNGKAIIVVPGGGYEFVSMDNEGFGVANRLADAGYAAFILKYRVRQTPLDPDEYMAYLASKFGDLGKGELPDHAPAIDDMAAAIRYVRDNAALWHVDPGTIGAVGFSAGARTLIRLIEDEDEANALDHVGLVYPPMTQTVAGGPRPSLFMAIAVDDPLFQQGGLNMVDKWLEESDDVEFHLYSGGSHGFGTRTIGTTSDKWMDHYVEWLGHQSKD